MNEKASFIGCWCGESLLRKINLVRSGNLSQFCRDALLEKLNNMGINVLPEEARPPEREKKPPLPRGGYSPNPGFNDKPLPNSKRASVSTVLLKKGVDSVLSEAQGSAPSPAVAEPTGKTSPPRSGNEEHPSRRRGPRAQVQAAPKDGEE